MNGEEQKGKRRTGTEMRGARRNRGWRLVAVAARAAAQAKEGWGRRNVTAEGVGGQVRARQGQDKEMEGKEKKGNKRWAREGRATTCNRGRGMEGKVTARQGHEPEI